MYYNIEIFTYLCFFMQGVKTALCSCSSSLFTADQHGNLCYQYMQNQKGITFDTAVFACSSINSNLPTFFTEQEYDDFLTYWQSNTDKPKAVVYGYVHDKGLAGLSDIISIYDGQNPHYNFFVAGQPDDSEGTQMCVDMWASQEEKGDDFECSGGFNLICQQSKVYDASITSLPCSQLCHGTDYFDRNFFSTNINHCQSGKTLVNSSIGFALTLFAPNVSTTVFELRDSRNRTQMITDASQLATYKSNGYTFQGLFYVPTIQLVSDMSKFSLLTNVVTNDTIIVEYNETDYRNSIQNGWGESIQFYLFLSPPSAGKCSLAKNCIWNDWQQWTPCTITCGGGGTRNSTRTKYYVESNGGTCDNQFVKTETCNNFSCPIDCQVSDWNKVYNCSTICNEGYEIWNKTILVQPAYGGQGCPTLVENRTCNLDNPCPIDCEISNWTQISSCSVTCGDGYELWNKSIIIENAYGGIPCPTHGLEETRVCNTPACIIPPVTINHVKTVLQAFQCLVIVLTMSTLLVLFLIFKVNSIERFIHMSQELALLMAHVLISFFAFRYQTNEFNHKICIPVSIILHYLFTVFYSFLVIESVQSYCIATNVLMKGALVKPWIYFAIGWCLPAAYSSTFAVVYYDYFQSQNSCWINWGHQYVSASALLFVFVFGYICLIFTEAGSMDLKGPFPMLNVNRWSASVVSLYSLLLIVPMNTISWLLGSLAVYHESIYLEGIMVALNIGLAIAMFNFHLASDEKVQKFVRQRFQLFKNK